ncbi:MAG: MBG domain-containing protein, partial [Prevotellaceae bacterium]|nr:MBG domain-containing protein [Prevotellaceae bacterium]
ITISGGTVAASSAYGNYISGSKTFIDGGSIKVNGNSGTQPANTSGTPVYLNVLTLDQLSAQSTPVTRGSIDNIPCDITPDAAQGVYGIKDVLTDAESKLYFWLPATGTSQIVSVTADTTYDNRFVRSANNSNADTLYRVPAVITGVTSFNGQEDTSGMVFITFSRPMPTGNTNDTVMLVCRECTVSAIVLPISDGAWENGGRSYKIPFKELEYSSTYRVYAAGFCDTTGRAVGKDTTHTFSTKLMQTITPAEYISEEPYTINNPIVAEKGEYTANNGGSEGNHTYQWYRSDDDTNAGLPIPGANDSSYTPATEDFGKYIYIETTPVGSEGHQVRPVPSERVRVGVKLTAEVSGAHGGAAIFLNGKSDTVVYDTDPVKLSMRKNFPDDRFVEWSDNPKEGTFFLLSDTAYSPSAHPQGDVMLTAALALDTPKITFPAADDITYGDALSKATLTGGSCSGAGSFAWEASDTVPKAGEHYLFVVFTPTDHMVDYDYSNLYGWDGSSSTVRRLVKVTVDKKDIFIIGGEVEQKIYDGSTAATVDSLIFSGLVEGDTLRPGKDYAVSNAGFDTPTAGSDKTVTLTVELTTSETASNYNLVNGVDYPLDEQSIDKAGTATDLLNYAPDVIVVYDGQQQHASVDEKSGVDGLGAITVLYNDDPTPPTNAGAYTVTVRIEEGGNYKDTVLTLGTLTISKAPMADTLLDFDVEQAAYDGAEHGVTVNPSFPCGEPCAIKITYNGDEKKPVDAGEYEVVITIVGAENYKDTIFTLAEKFIIDKAQLTEDLLEFIPGQVTYDGAEHGVTVTPSFPCAEPCTGLGNITITYNGFEDKPVDAGEYAVVVTIEGSNSYNDTILTLGTFTVSKAPITDNLLDFDLNQVIYDGAEHGVTVTPSFPCGEPCASLGSITVFYSGSEDKPVEAGEYEVAVTIEGGENYRDTTLTLGTLTISKAGPTADLLSYNPDDWVATYSRTPQDVSVDEKSGVDGLGAITVLYNGDSTPPTNAGAYAVTVRIEEGANYRDTVLTLGTLTINKAQLTEDDLKFDPIQDTYDGAEHGVTVAPSFPCAEPCNDIGVVTVTYNGDKNEPVNEGEYIVAVTITEGSNFAEVTQPLVLGIFRIKQPTILSDTVCLNEAYGKNGFSLPAQTESGLLRYVNTIKKERYDSVAVLNLRVYEPILFSVENSSICADDTVVEVKYELDHNSRIPSYYSIAFDKTRSFFTCDIENAPLPAAISMPRGAAQVRPDVYNATFRLSDDRCHSEAQPLSITVRYPSSIMEQKWDNAIALLNQRYNWGGYDFIAYRWFKDGEEILGATQPYLHTSSALDSGSYSVLLTGSDGVAMHTCPLVLAPAQNSQNSHVDISAYPTILNASSSITIVTGQQGEAAIRNIYGVEVSRQKFGDGTSSIAAPEQPGIYFVELSVNGQKPKVVKILVR